LDHTARYDLGRFNRPEYRVDDLFLAVEGCGQSHVLDSSLDIVLASLATPTIHLVTGNGSDKRAFDSLAPAIQFARSNSLHQYLDLAGGDDRAPPGLVIMVENGLALPRPYFASNPSFTVTAATHRYHVHLLCGDVRDHQIISSLQRRFDTGPIRILDRVPLPYREFSMDPAELKRLRDLGVGRSKSAARFLGLSLAA
jgi:hypothetical protein